MDTLFSELKPLDICSEKQYKSENSSEEISSTNSDASILDTIDIKNLKAEPKNSTNKLKGIGVLHTSTVNTSNEFIKSTQEIVQEKQQQEVKELSNINVEFPYKRTKLLTDAELQLFHFMENNLCQIDRITILAKVRLADIAEVDTRVTLKKEFLWKITNKHVDFLICNKNTLDIICAVELDDYTHETQEAKDRDMFIMQVLDAVGIKTIRIRTKIRAIEKRDLVLVDDCINRKLAPKCPYCGKQMYPKESRTGHRFYACEDFINCRRTIDIDPRGEKLP